MHLQRTFQAVLLAAPQLSQAFLPESWQPNRGVNDCLKHWSLAHGHYGEVMYLYTELALVVGTPGCVADSFNGWRKEAARAGKGSGVLCNQFAQPPTFPDHVGPLQEAMSLNHDGSGIWFLSDLHFLVKDRKTSNLILFRCVSLWVCVCVRVKLFPFWQRGQVLGRLPHW